MSEYIELAVLSMFGVALLETLAVLVWWERTWSFGIPVFSANRRLHNPSSRLDQDMLAALPEKALGAGQPLVFRQFADGSLAFRESFRPQMSGLTYTPIMRGRARIDPWTTTLKVTGTMHVFSTFMLLLFLVIPVAGYIQIKDAPAVLLLFPVFAVAIFAGIGWTQARRFRKVADHIQEFLNEAK